MDTGGQVQQSQFIDTLSHSYPSNVSDLDLELHGGTEEHDHGTVIMQFDTSQSKYLWYSKSLHSNARQQQVGLGCFCLDVTMEHFMKHWNATAKSKEFRVTCKGMGSNHMQRDGQLLNHATLRPHLFPCKAIRQKVWLHVCKTSVPLQLYKSIAQPDPNIPSSYAWKTTSL